MMNILSTLFIIVFSTTQVKNENIILDSNDCQTKCPIKRQTIRPYPPGTLLFVGDECVCGGAQETIYEYVPAVQRIGNGAIPVDFKSKKLEPQSNNRIMGNYGSLVFSANIQVLDLLRITNDDICIECIKPDHERDQKASNPSNDRLISTTNKPTEEINISTTIPVFKNVSDIKNKTNITYPDIEKYTDENMSMFTEPILENSMVTKVKESSPESNVTNNSSEIQTSIDIKIQTTTISNQKKEDLKQSNIYNDSNSKERLHLSDKFKVMIIDSYSNKKSDLEIFVINTDTFNFNN
ncbi:uncharacterized protein LOC112604356 [Melanaphis sacchari]|uniref:uncharacterized protein LOC112604356 n=1 Tax=Melanaphis sacchari TaxID=742174 RepID=UPI000DC14CD1|nr:uncharacterized protein LOC112604356 [Melanaphis sacchari]